MKKYAILPVVVFALWGSACVGAPPSPEKPQFTQWHYVFSVLLAPELPDTSPHLDLAMSLLRMEYPSEQAEYLKQILYLGADSDEYKDRIIQEHREKYRNAVSQQARTAGRDAAEYNWHYTETVDVRKFLHEGMVLQHSEELSISKPSQPGIVVERDLITHTGTERPIMLKRFYNIDMDDLILIKLDHLFANFQEETRVRDFVYEELRKYSSLERGQSLSQGIFFTNEPELSFNFFITDEGLVLHWDPDQIAPYVHGDIEIMLPWQIIRPMMLFTGIELLTKFNIYLFI